MSRWPSLWHAILAIVAVSLVLLLAWLQMQHNSKLFAAQKTQVSELLNQLQTLSSNQTASQTDFTAALPLADQADDLARDINRFAQDLGVQISSITIDTKAPTSTELGRMQFNVAAQAPYKASKTWLSELMGRYPSLGVASLFLQAQLNDPSRQDMRVVLVWVFRG